MSIDKLTATPIGIIHSPFLQQEGTPIQPYSAKGVEGSVEMYTPYAEGLADLEGFERILLVYWFDRACAPKLSVLPYRDTREHGWEPRREVDHGGGLTMSSLRASRKVMIAGSRVGSKETRNRSASPIVKVLPVGSPAVR